MKPCPFCRNTIMLIPLDDGSGYLIKGHDVLCFLYKKGDIIPNIKEYFTYIWNIRK